MIVQPENSRLCGQCCLATLLGISLAKAIELVGHEKGTYSRELLKFLPHKKIKRGKPKGDFIALCKGHHPYRYNDSTHWLVYNNGKYYDSNLGVYWCTTIWDITSFYIILKPTTNE